MDKTMQQLKAASPYSGVLTREQFLFYETRTTAKLLDEGLSPTEIQEKIVQENLFQYPTEKSVQQMARTCIQRVQALDDADLTHALASAPSEVSKQICLYAMMRQYRLMWDFMVTVIGEKYRSLDTSFSKTDVNAFLFRLQEQDDWVATWSDKTIAKLRQVLIKTLVETEYLEYLVAHVYSARDDIDKNAATDADIVAALRGDLHNGTMPGMEPNHAAAVKMEEYLEMQRQKQRPTTMQDIQSRYQAIPYGWREIDIAVVAAMLIWEQKVTIKYGGATVQPTDPKLPDLLRKRSEIGKTSIAIRQHPNLQHLKEARAYLRDYFDVMDVPEDEDSLVRFITEKFTAQREHYAALDARYNDHRYPDRPAVQSALRLCEEVLAQRKDNIALIEALINKEDDLDDSRDEMQRVESFFKNQVTVFDEAVKLDADLRNDLTYLETKPDAINALNKIRLITQVQPGERFDYRRIPELNELMRTVRAGRDELLADKRAEMLENVRQCMEAVHTAAGGDPDAKNAVTRADAYYDDVKKKIDSFTSLLMLDGLLPQMLQYRDTACESIEALKRPATPAPAPTAAPVRKKLYKPCFRTVVFQAKTLETEADIDEYLRRSKQQLLAMLQNCDGVQLK